MKQTTVYLFLAFLLTLPASAQSLFDTLKSHDGKTYAGRMSYPSDPEHEMNQPMLITVVVVSDDEIRVPFQVGSNRSRTWVLTRNQEEITLKHDHRHTDGTPDELTNYGGTDKDVLLGNQLVFPADDETKAMLPEASSNVWTLRLSPDGKKLFYYLERHKTSRFEAVFKL